MRYFPANIFPANIAALLLAGLMLSGGVLVAAGTAGGVAATEMSEEDDQFDPLERTEVYEETDEAVDEIIE